MNDPNNPFSNMDPMGTNNGHFAELSKLADMANNPALAAKHAEEMAKMGIPPPFTDFQDMHTKLMDAHKFYSNSSQQNQAVAQAGQGQMAQGSTPVMPSPQDLASLLKGGI